LAQEDGLFLGRLQLETDRACYSHVHRVV
jgi:hypothetical protein